MYWEQLLRKLRALKDEAILVLGDPGRQSGRKQVGEHTLDFAPQSGTNYSLILAFASNREALDGELRQLLPFDDARTRLWICYPKKTGSLASDLSREAVGEAAATSGHRPVGQVAVDNDWSALRIRPAASVRQKAAAIPGIDLENRSVTPPEDLVLALEASNMTGAFDRLSFTHKKEYVKAIVTARKAETRERRIDKCIEMLRKHL